MTSDSLVKSLQQFLLEARNAVVVEDGAMVFDLAEARYSVSGDHNKCLLQFWSSERNIVRRVLDAELKNDILRLQVQRLGQARPSKLDICRERETWRQARLSASSATRAHTAVSWIQNCRTQHFNGPGTIL